MEWTDPVLIRLGGRQRNSVSGIDIMTGENSCTPGGSAGGCTVGTSATEHGCNSGEGVTAGGCDNGNGDAPVGDICSTGQGDTGGCDTGIDAH